MTDPIILQITNHHVETTVREGGAPPRIKEQPGRYIGYFENEYGEQWLFVLDHGSETGMLYGGDVGWEQGYPVVDGVADDLILNAPEIAWLQACWAAATAGRVAGGDPDDAAEYDHVRRQRDDDDDECPF